MSESLLFNVFQENILILYVDCAEEVLLKLKRGVLNE